MDTTIPANLRSFTLDDLKVATADFHPSRLLGRGGFGSVFKGWLDPNTYDPTTEGQGIPVAVKKSSSLTRQGRQEWEAELRFMGRFSHPNLVKVIGYCQEQELPRCLGLRRRYLIVYEYMENGTLREYLDSQSICHSWASRIQIALEAARGLAYLHLREPAVIHRDLKTSNILLDSGYSAKLSDFGLARFGPTDGRSHVTSRVKGTYGYMDSQYLKSGHLYIKSDVYSFGVVLLEILTARHAYDETQPAGYESLVERARGSLFNLRELNRLADPRLHGARIPDRALLSMGTLIWHCIKPEHQSRPTMEHVESVLMQISRMNL